MNYVTRFLSKLEGVRPTESGDRWRAICPSHDDSNPSLEVAVGEEGGILLKCWSGCSSKKILKAMDLEFHHLYPGRGEQVYSGAAKSLPPSSAKKQVARFHEIYSDLIAHLGIREEDLEGLKRRGLTAETSKRNGYASLRWFDAVKLMNGLLKEKYGKDRLLMVPGFVWEGQYGRFEPAVKEGLLIPVRNLEGQIVGLKVRTGGNPKYRWFSGNGSPSIGNPYHVAVPIPSGSEVIITEGPLKADVVARFLPTRSVVGISGVDSWKTVLPLIEQIKPRGIYLAFDSDWEVNSSVAEALGDFLDEIRKRGVPVWVASWPVSLGKGLDDALKAGGDDFGPEWIEGNTVKPELLKVAKNNDIGINHTIHQSHSSASGTDVSVSSPIRLTRGSEVVVKSTSWLWPGRIPYGAITLVEGDPGVGKSFFLCDLAARVTKGSAFPPVTKTLDFAKSGNVIYVSSEDPKDTVLMPRFLAARGSADNIYFLDGIEKDGQDVPLSIPDDLTELRRVITQRGASLVVFDPLTAFLSEKVDSHKDTDVRRALTPLHKLAEDTGVAVVGVRHFRKDGTGKAIHRGGGSIGFTAQARSVLLVTRDPDDQERRILAHSKTNLGPLKETLAYYLDQDGQETRVSWDQNYVPFSADEILASPTSAVTSGALEMAAAWLANFLKEGEPVPALRVFYHAKHDGISETTLKRAKKVLGVVTTQSNRQHVWSLPKGEE